MVTISFKSEDVSNRIFERLNSSSKAGMLLAQNSVSRALVNQIANVFQEQAEYVDYLARKNNFILADDRSDLLSYSNMLKYRFKGAKSAITTLCVSVDSKIKKINDDLSYSLLDNYSLEKPIKDLSNVYIDYIISTSNSVKFFPLKNRKLDFTDKAYFYLECIQGEKKVITIVNQDFTYALQTKYLPFVCSDNIEEGLADHSKFKYVRVYFSSTNYKDFRIVDNIYSSLKNSYDCEIRRDDKNTSQYYLVFSNSDNFSYYFDSYSYIEFHYVSSIGSTANLDTLYNKFDIHLSDGEVIFGINVIDITSGEDAEKVDDIKTLAPIKLSFKQVISNFTELKYFLKDLYLTYSYNDVSYYEKVYDAYVEKSTILVNNTIQSYKNNIYLHFENSYFLDKTESLKTNLQAQIEYYIDPLILDNIQYQYDFTNYITKTLEISFSDEVSVSNKQEISSDILTNCISKYANYGETLENKIKSYSILGDVLFIDNTRVLIGNCILNKSNQEGLNYFMTFPFNIDGYNNTFRIKRYQDGVYKPFIIQLTFNNSITTYDYVISLIDNYSSTYNITLDNDDSTYIINYNLNSSTYYSYAFYGELFKTDQEFIQNAMLSSLDFQQDESQDGDESESESETISQKIINTLENINTSKFLEINISNLSTITSYNMKSKILNSSVSDSLLTDFGFYYDSMGYGEIYLSYDNIYSILKNLANKDKTLNNLLEYIHLSLLKCDTLGQQRQEFIKILKQYMDIRVLYIINDYTQIKSNTISMLSCSNLSQVDKKLKKVLS